jgi:acetyl-CoA acyltransferase
MDIYAGFCRMHMREFGTTQEQLAVIASKNHQHSTMNPLSQFQRPFTVEEVMTAAPITYPLTLPMCSPISDGAAAAIVCNAAGLAKLNAAKARNMRVLATVMQSGSNRGITEFEKHASKLAALKAYEKAGVGPEDISLAEVHDATAMGEIIELEALGLCKLGDGGPAAARGETRLGGRLPVNPSGGLESKGHPIGATGLAQIYELVTQLRGEAGRAPGRRRQARHRAERRRHLRHRGSHHLRDHRRSLRQRHIPRCVDNLSDCVLPVRWRVVCE